MEKEFTRLLKVNALRKGSGGNFPILADRIKSYFSPVFVATLSRIYLQGRVHLVFKHWSMWQD